MEDNMTRVVRELITRRLGDYNDQIILEIIEPEQGRDVFEVASEGDKVV